MTRQSLIQVTTTLGLFTLGLILVIGITMLIPPPYVTTHTEELTRVNDRPLLETPRQVYEARTTPYSTFHIGNEYYVVEHLPKEYIDYSSWYVRMP